MPPVCAKCKQSAFLEGDTWCAACSSWEALGRDLSAHWEQVGCRTLAADLVVNCVRQVRALRNLGAGLSRSIGGGGDAAPSRLVEAGVNRAPPEPPGLSPKAASKGVPAREELPRRRSSEARGVKDEPSDQLVGEEAEESEELPPSPHHQPIFDRTRRPPEPDHSPPREKRKESSRHSGGHRNTREETRGKRETGQKSKRRRTSHRGGRKHQRLHRLAANPTLPVHRKPSEEFFILTSIAQGDQALHRY